MSEIYKAFQYDDPEIIAEIINMELNTIIETIAPSKYKKYKKIIYLIMIIKQLR